MEETEPNFAYPPLCHSKQLAYFKALITCMLQVVMLGSGVPEFEQRMRQEEQERPDHFRGWVGFSVPVSHRIMAGCDMLLMPSRFEPCGLNQLFGMRYGTIPIAHATGGLRDTIEDYNPFADSKQSLLGVQLHCMHPQSSKLDAL